MSSLTGEWSRRDILPMTVSLFSHGERGTEGTERRNQHTAQLGIWGVESADTTTRMLLHRRSTKENKRKDPIAFVCGVGQTMSTRWLELKRGRKRPYIYRQSGDSSSASLSSCSQGRNARHGKGSKDAIVYQVRITCMHM